MKKILLASVLFALPFMVQAQTFGSYGEYDVVEDDTDPAFKMPTARVPASAPEASESESVQEPKPAGLFPELNNNGTEPAKTREGHLLLRAEKVNILKPPVGGVSICYADLMLENQLNVTLKSLKVTATYGTLETNMVFRDVASGSSAADSIAMAGPSCDSLMGTPVLKVTECRLVGVENADCQSHLKYKPIE